jgi:hypothetical protein
MKTSVKPTPDMVTKKTLPLWLISGLSSVSNSCEYGG